MSKVTISHKAIIKRKSLIIIMIIYGYNVLHPKSWTLLGCFL